MPDPNIACSWCGRPQNEVVALIPSPQNSKVHICDNCVGKCSQALSQHKRPEDGDSWKLPKPLELLTLLNEYVIGQDSAKKVVASAVYNHYKRRLAASQGVNINHVEVKKCNTIITGPSGCGKTQILRVLAKILKVPFFVQDATRLTQAGYVGDDVEIMLQGLLEQCNWDVDKAKWGIIGIDEVDKLGRKSGREVSGYRDVNGEGVQQALLKIVEGGEHLIPMGLGARVIDQKVLKLDTTNILFFGLGSFAGLDEVVRRRVNKSSRIGFGGKLREDVSLEETFSHIDEEDILDFGFIPEFTGRFPLLTSVLPLKKEELVKILTEPKDALVEQQKFLYSLDKVELEFEDAALQAIAAKAVKKETGARALQNIIENILLPYNLTIPSDPSVRKIRITEETVTGKGEAVIIRDPGVRVAQA